MFPYPGTQISGDWETAPSIRVETSTQKYVIANLIEHGAPVLASLFHSIARPPFDLSGPCALHVVV